MAAHPLPETPPVLIVNAATATVVNAVAGQPISWQNSNTSDVDIVVTPSGAFPLEENTFKVKGTNGPISTKANGVLVGCPANSYSFSRNGVMGSGRIIVTASR
jgi:hypothetical protein